mgnify:CR=1 FL=1
MGEINKSIYIYYSIKFIGGIIFILYMNEHITKTAKLFFVIEKDEVNSNEEAIAKAKSQIEQVNNESPKKDSIGTININIEREHNITEVARDYDPQFTVSIQFIDDTIDNMNPRAIVTSNFNSILGADNNNRFESRLDHVAVRL